jgi:uncharacterized membrane protein YtjA (UPF0391 family)
MSSIEIVFVVLAVIAALVPLWGISYALHDIASILLHRSFSCRDLPPECDEDSRCSSDRNSKAE